MPMPDPDTVTLTEPVLAVLPRPTPDTDPASYDAASVAVPDLAPTVTTIRRVCWIPLAVLPVMLLSEDQMVASIVVPVHFSSS
jgi:hypothetical protein